MNGIVRWVKFSAVGLMGVGVQLGALFFLTRVGGMNYLLATVLAVECAVVHNFAWHQRFTWRDRGRRHILGTLARLVRFNAGNGAISLIGNVMLMRLLVGQLHFRVMLANLISIASCALANFIVSDRWVFVANRSDHRTDAKFSHVPQNRQDGGSSSAQVPSRRPPSGHMLVISPDCQR